MEASSKLAKAETWWSSFIPCCRAIASSRNWRIKYSNISIRKMAINMNLAMQLYSQKSKMLIKDFMPTCKVIKLKIILHSKLKNSVYKSLKKPLLFKKQWNLKIRLLDVKRLLCLYYVVLTPAMRRIEWVIHMLKSKIVYRYFNIFIKNISKGSTESLSCTGDR